MPMGTQLNIQMGFYSSKLYGFLFQNFQNDFIISTNNIFQYGF